MMVLFTDPGSGHVSIPTTGCRFGEPTEALAARHSQETGSPTPPSPGGLRTSSNFQTDKVVYTVN